MHTKAPPRRPSPVAHSARESDVNGALFEAPATAVEERWSQLGHRLEQVPTSRPPSRSSGAGSGLPDRLKAGLEHLSGVSMDDVSVHYNSSRPSQLEASAYTQGSDIHVGPGEERHLAHEAWHVVQQKQGRVRPTTRLGAMGVNADPTLEREADVMAARVGQTDVPAATGLPSGSLDMGQAAAQGVAQLKGGKKGKGKKKGASKGASASSSTPPAVQQDAAEEVPAEDDVPVEDRPFGNRASAIAYMASKYQFDPEQIQELIAFSPDRFEGIEDFSPSVFDGDDSYGKFLEGLERQMESMPDVGSGKRSGGDWATKKVRTAATQIVDKNKGDDLFQGGKYTMHHKISRNRLRTLHGQMESAGGAAQPLRNFLGGMEDVVGAQSSLKVLLNMPGNIEVGPASDKRVEDPGTGFDPNLKSGQMTPRSTELNAVDSQIGSGGIDWNEVAKRLQKVQALQNQHGGVLSDPLKEQWSKAKGGKFKRE